MSDIITYRDLDAWQLSMELVEDIYRTTAAFPNRLHHSLELKIARQREQEGRRPR